MSHAQTPSAPDKPRPAAAAASSPSEPTPSPTPIVSVRIVNQDGHVISHSPDDLKDISVRIGFPLDREQIADSIRALYRTGDYADISVVESPINGGLQIDFVVRPELFFNQLLIQGLTSPPTESSASAAMQIALGQPFRRDILDDGLARLRDALREEGLYTAQVSAETVPHPATRQIDVVVHIKPGPRARISGVQLKNGTEYADREILSRFKMKPGVELTSARIQRGTERIRKLLVKQGHLNGRAVAHRGDYDAAKNTVPIELDVSEGPKVQLAITGVKISNGELRKLVPVYQEGAVDTDLLEEGKRNIRERLERLGYFDAEVDYSTSERDVQLSRDRKGVEELITYRVERGDRHKLTGIEIAGNRYFSTDLLRSRLQIATASFGVRARLSRRLLEADRISMHNLYLANGFLDAKVEAQALDNYRGKEGELLVRFTIEEGKQTRVASLSIEGDRAIKQADLLNVIGSTPGEPYSDFTVVTDRDNILALYFNEGFPGAQFTSTAEPIAVPSPSPSNGQAHSSNDLRQSERPANGDGHTLESATPSVNFVRLVYRIDEGRRFRVNRVLLTGYQHTRRGILQREINVQPNAPLREGDIAESQRRLYNLGIFNRVTIEPQNPNGTDTDKDIVVLVEEAKRYTLAYGGGFEVQRLASTTNPTGGEIQAAVRGILEVSKINLTGRADSLSLKLRGSTIEDRALLGYSDPNIFADPHLSFQATAYTEKSQDINTFTEMRYEGSLQLSDQVTSRTSLAYRYTFRKVLVSNVNILPQDIPLISAPTLVSEFGVTWARDARDNPADPSKGNFNSVEVSDAASSIGSSASFLHVLYQNSSYHPIKPGFGFARGIRFGILEPYGQTVTLPFPSPAPGQCAAGTSLLPSTLSIIPLPERFFAGGGTSLRGFALNQAGPRDPCTGFPVGGQAMLVLNQEFRFPMRLPYIGTALGGAIFYDGGNVYSRLSKITFRAYSPAPVFNPANPTECQLNCTNELNYFAHTIGFGFRYSTPFGPIRVDLAYQLNRPYFVAPICPSGDKTCANGQNGQQATRLPGFQIFFNLGPSF